MRRIALITAFIGSCLLSFSQERKFSFGASVFPNMSKSIITDNGTEYPWLVDWYREHEKWKLSYSAEIYTQYSFSDKSHLAVGLGYTNTGSKDLTDLSSYDDPIEPIEGFTDEDGYLPKEIRNFYNFNYLDVSVGFQQYVLGDFYLLAGGVFQYNLSNKRITKKIFRDGDTTKEKSDYEAIGAEFRQFNFSGFFALGLDFLKRDNYTLFVHPRVQYAFGSLWKDTSINRNYLSVGITTGIRI